MSNTPDKRVEEIRHAIIQFVEDLCIGEGNKRAGRENITTALDLLLTQYHQDMMSEVVEKIETLKEPLKECGICIACMTAMHCTTAEAHLQANQALTEAQTIIKSK